MMNLIERLWCKLFHVWDNYERLNYTEMITDRIASNYDIYFCPLCQKCRFKLKDEV